MTFFEEFSDPRLVTLYDWWDPFRTDIGFYLDLAAPRPGSVILDVGCGTGLLATQLAQRGHAVTGVDPAPAMLGVARRRPGGDLVRWIEGDASCLEETGADLTLMTGHVAQIISDDGEWHATLAAIHRALRPGGRLAFESRNPRAQGWLRWTPEGRRPQIRGFRAGGSLAVASSTPATQLLSPAKMLKLNHAPNARFQTATD